MHLVMELCEGGSVLDGLKDGEYSERQVRAARLPLGGATGCRRLLQAAARRCRGPPWAAAWGFAEWGSRRVLLASPRAPRASLASLVPPAHPPTRQVAHIMRAVVRFIAQCHAKGLIYRDIKPGGWAGGSVPSPPRAAAAQRVARAQLCGLAAAAAAARTPCSASPPSSPTATPPPPPPPLRADNFLLVSKVKPERSRGSAGSASLYSAGSDGDASEPDWRRLPPGLEMPVGRPRPRRAPPRSSDASAASDASGSSSSSSEAGCRPQEQSNILPSPSVWKYISRKVSAARLPAEPGVPPPPPPPCPPPCRSPPPATPSNALARRWALAAHQKPR